MAEGEDKPTKLRKLERNSKGELVAVLDGRDKPVEDVSVVRCFPWSLSEEYISVRDKDGKEVALLRNLGGLDRASLELLKAELHDKFFVPRILRVTQYKAEFDVVSISAVTDRGEVTFQIRDRDDVRLLSPERALFRDVDGNIYEVEDFNALDRATQKRLEQFF